MGCNGFWKWVAQVGHAIVVLEPVAQFAQFFVCRVTLWTLGFPQFVDGFTTKTGTGQLGMFQLGKLWDRFEYH